MVTLLPPVFALPLPPPPPDREKQLSEALKELKELRTAAANWGREKKALEGQVGARAAWSAWRGTLSPLP